MSDPVTMRIPLVVSLDPPVETAATAIIHRGCIRLVLEEEGSPGADLLIVPTGHGWAVYAHETAVDDPVLKFEINQESKLCNLVAQQ